MKNPLFPKTLFLALVLFSAFSFAYVNWQGARKAQSAKAPTTLVQPDLTRQEEQSEEDRQETRLPDVAVLGFLLHLAGKFLPVAN